MLKTDNIQIIVCCSSLIQGFQGKVSLDIDIPNFTQHLTSHSPMPKAGF